MDKLIDSIMEKLLSGGYVREDEADIVRFGLELNIMKVLISAAMLVYSAVHLRHSFSWRYIRLCAHAAAVIMLKRGLPALYCPWL